MAVLTYQQSQAKGVSLTLVAANAGGDEIAPNDRGVLLVRNGSGASINVTITTPGNDKYDQARPDIVTAVAAGATATFGPFPTDLANPADGRVDIGYSAAASVTVGGLAI